MTNEEIQRTMDFILGQQAQIAASFQRQEEERKRDGARIKRLEEAFQLVAQLAQATETRLERLETPVPISKFALQISTLAWRS